MSPIQSTIMAEKKIIYLLILFPWLVVLEDLDKVSPLTVARMYDVCHAQHVLNIL